MGPDVSGVECRYAGSILKNTNSVKEFGAEGGFWKLLSDGVAYLKVQEGHILIKIKE